MSRRYSSTASRELGGTGSSRSRIATASWRSFGRGGAGSPAARMSGSRSTGSSKRSTDARARPAGRTWHRPRKGDEMPNISLGEQEVTPDMPAHTPGIQQGNAKGSYEKA